MHPPSLAALHGMPMLTAGGITSFDQRPVVDDDPLESGDLIGRPISRCSEVSRLSVSS